ncbi:unnamed protein product [Euphydryas editha]|uniref:Uncharacterized protein n=1 Tax=Euphydryas editha TaxID=104508 RepID=A0AAU9V9T3_EUPED|nr:unnamed protein product [Euphydryas editha]
MVRKGDKLGTVRDSLLYDVQETRWKGNKSRSIGKDYQLVYSGIYKWLLSRPMWMNFLAEVENQNLSTQTETADRARTAIIATERRILGVSKERRVIDKETCW